MLTDNRIFSRIELAGFIFCVAILFACSAAACGQDKRQPVQPQASRPIDDEVGFRILVWQYRNDAVRDASLYRKANLRGFHIDYGEGQKNRANWAKQQNWPYYVDHAAGKGILHLTPRSGLNTIPRDGTPAKRPWSYFESDTQKELADRLSRNVPPIADGPVLAIALDDEVSLGTFNSPLELDYSDSAIEEFRKWLPGQYKNDSELRIAWELKKGELPNPMTFEKIRAQITSRSPSTWRLAPWIDFRSFMDSSQASLFAGLVRKTNQLAPGVPVGVVGGQQPSAYGGFDYSKLRHALQWTEAYDIGGTNEILHSFWSSAPRGGRMQTYFLSGNLKQDKWFLWYYLAHGNRGVIAWPDMKKRPWFENGKTHPYVQQLSKTFAAVQDDSLGVLAHPNTEPIFSPVAILYSHPSVQVGWAIDATAHGKTWPRRSSSLDNSCLSSGKNRIAWTRLLEDLGYQSRFIDSTELITGNLESHKCKVLILPQAFALSPKECAAIVKFAEKGGLVIADYGTAITDEHGKGYRRSPLDAMFGIDRSNDKGWFNGKSRFEINGESYQRPFAQRFAQKDILKDRELTVVERSLASTNHTNRTGKGNAIFINSSPTLYFDPVERAGEFGKRWRKLISTCFSRHAVEPEVQLKQTSGVNFGVELIRYRQKVDREVWAIVTNPTRQATVNSSGSGLNLSPKEIGLTIEARRGIVNIRDVRTGKKATRNLRLPADEALVLEVTFASNPE